MRLCFAFCIEEIFVTHIRAREVVLLRSHGYSWRDGEVATLNCRTQ